MNKKITHEDDSAAIDRILNGDRAAFSILDQKYRSVSVQVAAKILGDPFEAEDAVQEAFYRAYNKLNQLADHSLFGPWFATIVKNTATDYLRKRMRRNDLATEDAVLRRLADTDRFENQGWVDNQMPDDTALEDRLKHLSPKIAQTVRLRVQSGQTLQEIAEQLEVPLGTVKRRIHDAKQKIKRMSMKQFTESDALAIVDEAKKEIDSLPTDIKEELLGVGIGGDLARGDFIPNYSNLLVFPFISNKNTFNVYDSRALKAVKAIFDELCKPFLGCAESPTVWDNLAIDQIHLPVTAEDFDPPTIPQPAWLSMFLFDLIDNHQMIYGDDFIADLYRPDPKHLTLRITAESLRVLRATADGKMHPPFGFETVAHWQALKMIRILQLHFADGEPTIAWALTLQNYQEHVPQFGAKQFGESLWKREMKRRFPADRKDFSASHANACVDFVHKAGELLRTIMD